MNNLTLCNKLNLFIFLVTIVISSVIVGYNIFTSYDRLVSSYTEYSLQIGTILADEIRDPLVEINIAEIRNHIASIKDKNIVRILVLDANNYVLTDGTKTNVDRGNYVNILLEKYVDWNISVDSSLIISRNVLQYSTKVGALYLEFSMEKINEDIENKLIHNIIVASFLSLVLIIVGKVLVKDFTASITALTESVNCIDSEYSIIPLVGSEEVRILSQCIIDTMAKVREKGEELKELNKDLDIIVRERTKKLGEAIASIESSIEYASRIQHSILPANEIFEYLVPKSFVVWKPRDIIGGDMYWCKQWGQGVLLLVGDCTGHGVPGSLMTLIVNGILSNAVSTMMPGNLDKLATYLNISIKNILKQKTKSGIEDGIELSAVYIDTGRAFLTFMGARSSLYYVDTDVVEIKGDRCGIGFSETRDDVVWTQHNIEMLPGRRFFMTTDGIIDQVGSGKCVGKRTFKKWCCLSKNTIIHDAGTFLYSRLLTYQGTELRRDDITIIGFESI